MTEALLMSHVLFGMLCIVSAVWLFVEVLNSSENNQQRIRIISYLVPFFMWLSFLIGGYWYIVHYGADKAVILKGPWKFSHTFFMEMKEHVVIMLLLLTTYLPIAASVNLARNKTTRKMLLWVVGLVILIGIAMDGAGAIIGIGVKVALMPH
ncbi:MAG: hypothetical protein V1742_09185 [Pseudomonadota bacterium]